MYGPKVISFQSFQAFLDYCEDHPEAQDSVSPGGAASMLGCDRQFVYSLARRGKVRAWTVYDQDVGPAGPQGIGGKPPQEKASFVFVCGDDLRDYLRQPKNKGGRPSKEKAAA